MRAIDEVRERAIGRVAAVIARPSMWAPEVREMDSFARELLQLLCFIDERDEEAKAFLDETQRYGKLGIGGAFLGTFGDDCAPRDEVISVYAEQFARMGYLQLARHLNASEWKSVGDLREQFEELDVRRSEVIAQVGEPSLTIDARVLCYAPEDNGRWVFFDFWEPRGPLVYEPGLGTFKGASGDDPLLRNIRVWAPTFEEGLILTLYGKVLRWGTGWWIGHEPVRGHGTPSGVAEQLKAIDDADPSQVPRVKRGH